MNLFLKNREPIFKQLRKIGLVRGTYYAYIDGNLEKAGGIYKTADFGSHWEKMTFPLSEQIKEIPVNKDFIDNELLNIVIGQVKNVCGCNNLLEVDAFRSGTLYAGERSSGIFKSLDGGKNWMNITADLPFLKDTASVLTVIKQDKKRGWLYAGFMREGLWRSKMTKEPIGRNSFLEMKICAMSLLYVLKAMTLLLVVRICIGLMLPFHFGIVITVAKTFYKSMIRIWEHFA